jgi:hypothetical protein
MFGESLLTGVDDLLDMFANRFFFGCEADDPMNALAFASDLNPGGVTLPAIFASDVGHWDVPDLRGVVPEAYELVEHGHIDREQFRDFVFDNPVKLWTAMNPGFFQITRRGSGPHPSCLLSSLRQGFMSTVRAAERAPGSNRHGQPGSSWLT